MPSIKDTNQEVLPRLPIPPLEDTLKRYLARLEPLQDSRSYEKTKRAVAESEQS